MTVAPKKNGDDGECHDREQYQHRDLPFRRRIGKEPERRAAVLHVGEAKESRDYLNGFMQGNIPGHNPFCRPVKDQDEQGNREVETARGASGHGS